MNMAHPVCITFSGSFCHITLRGNERLCELWRSDSLKSEVVSNVD